MTIATVPLIMARVAAATESSPIAVFYTSSKEPNRLNTFFADTVGTQQLMRKEPENLVGVFHNNHEKQLVAIQLVSALKQNRI